MNGKKHAWRGLLLLLVGASFFFAAPLTRDAPRRVGQATMVDDLPTASEAYELEIQRPDIPSCTDFKFIGVYCYTLVTIYLIKWDTTTWTQVWNYTSGSYYYSLSPCDDGVCVVASGRLEKVLANGSSAWNASLSSHNVSLDTYSALMCFDTVGYISGRNITSSLNGILLAFSTATGSVIWARPLTGTPVSYIWTDGSDVYVHAYYNPVMFKYDVAGSLVWSKAGCRGVRSCSGNGTSFYTAGTYVTKWTTGGTMLWNVSIPTGDYVIDIVATTDTVYTNDGMRLFKWRASTGVLVWTHTSSPYYTHAFEFTGEALYSCVNVGGFIIVKWCPNGFTGNAQWVASPSPFIPGTAVSFSVPVDAGDAPLQCQWDFGDGSANATASSVLHSFAAVGDYTVRLFVQDVEGDTASYGGTFRVLPLDGDEDDDGMKNGWEAAHGFNITNASDATLDPDDDGVTNLAEHDHGSDPFDQDTDDDGLGDGWEINVYGSDPTKVDTDGDGWSDDWEAQYYSDPTNPWIFPMNFLGVAILRPPFGMLAYGGLVGIVVLIIAGIVHARKKKHRPSGKHS